MILSEFWTLDKTPIDGIVPSTLHNESLIYIMFALLVMMKAFITSTEIEL